jgi:nitrite reductase/ring-hydroxylating ferredoxin subunit
VIEDDAGEALHEWHVTDLVAEGDVGQIFGCEVSGELVALTRIGEWWVAFPDSCTHAKCRFSKFGEVDGLTLICNCHGAEFDLETGEVMRDPAVEPLRMLDVDVYDGRLAVRRRPAGDRL